jgi:hypothetical protein
MMEIRENVREFQKFVMIASPRGYYGKRAWVEDDTNRWDCPYQGRITFAASRRKSVKMG